MCSREAVAASTRGVWSQAERVQPKSGDAAAGLIEAGDECRQQHCSKGGGRSSDERGNAHGPAIAPAALKKITVLPVPGGVLHAGEQQPVAVEAAVLRVVLEQALANLLVVGIIADAAGGQR